MNKKIVMIVVSVIVIVAVMIVGVMLWAKAQRAPEQEESINVGKEKSEIEVVPTMEDKISDNSMWCPTFQLVWNDMKNEVVKRDIVFNPQITMVENLNKEDFTSNMLSDSYYYKKYGVKTKQLKEEIEKGIKEKFNETSDILDDFGWDEKNTVTEEDASRYFFYAMLKRDFEFPKEFDNLGEGEFGNSKEKTTYFGINNQTDKVVKNQVEVLFYHSKDEFAVLLNTKDKDEIILYKTKKGNNFNQIYKNMQQAESSFNGNTDMQEKDELKVPVLNINEKKEYTELENQPFETSDKTKPIAVIEKAIQTIKLKLNEKGGSIKSEAGIDMKLASAVKDSEEDKPRYFYLDNDYVLFLREKGKEKPYFAAKIHDISQFN